MRNDYREALTELGFGLIEIGLIECVLIRMGVLPQPCEHERPRFIECYELNADGSINEARWQKAMREMGFRPDAIRLAEHGLFGDMMGRC